MGGAVAVPGNASAAAEANVWHDPEAADLVFQAGWYLDEFSGRPPVSVAVDVAADRFLDDFVDRLTGATADHRQPVAD